MRNSSIGHIRTLYLVCAGILVLCIALTLGDVLRSEERPRIPHFPDTSPTYAFRITDLDANNAIYSMEHEIAGTAEGVTAHTHVNQYDVDIFTNDDRIGRDPRIAWVIVLQGVSILSLMAILVLVVIVLISFYRSARRGHIFPSRNIVMLTIIGILQTFFSLCLDTSTYLERRVVLDLLASTEWQPAVHFTIHFTRIFFGLTLIFLAQIFHIGRQLQEEQELTI